MPEPNHRSSVIPAIAYKDPLAAIDWLEEAFGFERTMVITDNDGNLAHSELSFGNGCLMVGAEWSESMKSPLSFAGGGTAVLHVQIEEDIDAHCERARKAGAVIQQEPEDQFYGDRTYRALDPEGHMWTFGQTTRAVSREEAEQASGLKIEGWT
jgi:uncharacterized glyoxalase superfamily protein PhnB